MVVVALAVRVVGVVAQCSNGGNGDNDSGGAAAGTTGRSRTEGSLKAELFRQLHSQS